MAGERLTRDLDEAMLGGVIAGIARRYDLDVTLLRLLAVIAIIPSGGIAVPVYLVAWLVVPRPDQVEAGQGAIGPLRERLRRDQVGTAAREAGDTARRAADRVADAARLASEAARTAADAARAAADAARTAAEEISDIAHQPRRQAGADATSASTPPASPPPPSAGPTPEPPPMPPEPSAPTDGEPPTGGFPAA